MESNLDSESIKKYILTLVKPYTEIQKDLKDFSEKELMSFTMFLAYYERLTHITIVNKNIIRHVYSVLIPNEINSRQSIEDTLNEAYLFSKDDIIMNLDSWKKEKGKNVLYITGLSGSGKTTLSNDYAKKYKAKLIELDDLGQYDGKGKDAFIKKHTIMMDKVDKDYGNLYIIEGVQIFHMDSYLKGKPLIIKNSSVVKSLLQRFKRNGDGKIEWIPELKNEFICLVKLYLEDNTSLDKYKKKLNESDISLRPSIDLSLDKDGNLLLTKRENVDFQTIYANSHELLKIYADSNNIEGMKYELCKLWMCKTLIDYKILYNKGIRAKLVSAKQRKQALITKSFIMSDIKLYLKNINEKETNFNFQEYFNKTQFGIEIYKIDNRVIKASKLLLGAFK